MALYGGIKLVDRPHAPNVIKLDKLQIPTLRKMQRYGFRIDIDAARDLGSRLTTRMASLRREIVDEIPGDSLDRFIDMDSDEDDSENNAIQSQNEQNVISDSEKPDDEYRDFRDRFNVESSQKISELLFNVFKLGDVGVEIKRTKGGKSSTGKKTLEQLKRSHPIVGKILEYREHAKLYGTYVRALPIHSVPHPKGPDCSVCGRKHYTNERRVHTSFATTRAVTGRICSRKPNLANIPARTKLGAEIRRLFIPSEGYKIVQRDWAQIELRLMADRSRDPVMIEVYANDGDIHITTAMKTFNIDDPTKVDKLLHRAPSKNTNFAVCYLITGQGLLDLMAVTFATANKPLPEWMNESWCDEFIQKWFGVYKGVRTYLTREEESIRRYGMAWTRMGRVRLIPGVKSALQYVREAGTREGSNHGIQGFSAELMKLALGEINERVHNLESIGISVYSLMSVYDELLCEALEDDCDVVQTMLGEVMDNVLVDRQTGILQCAVPIQSDGKIMSRWEKE